MLQTLNKSIFNSFKRNFVTKFTKEHEWLKVQGKVGVFGITDYAQKALGDVVYIELPSVGQVEKGESIGAVESVKAASDVYSPVNGKVVKVNEALNDNPSLINKSPFDQGWIAEIEIKDEKQLDGLMSEEAYNEFIQ